MEERFHVTEIEREKVLKSYFRKGLDGPLDTFPSKDKKKYIIAQEIIKHFKVGNVYLEKEINSILKEIHPDFATVRRFFIDYGFMNRSDDGKEYWIEKKEVGQK